MATNSEFELRDHDHSDLFGVFLGVHALPGSVMFLHTTVGCKFKTQLQLVYHDWFRESHNQRLWTGVDDVRLIEGSGERLLQFARTWYERRKPGLAVVTTNASVELSPFDVAAAVDQLRETLPCPVVLLPAPGHTGGLRNGYERMIEAVSGLVDWAREPEPGSICLAGYMFDRFEMDHVANLNELKRLLRGLGLRPMATLFGGEPFESVVMAHEAESILLLPYAGCLAHPDDDAFGGRRAVKTPLPVGIRGSSAFVSDAGAAAGVEPSLVREAIDRETAKVVPLLAHAARALDGKRVAVFLDTFMASAVTAFALDLGAEVPLVCLTDGNQADKGTFLETLDRLAPHGYAAPEVLAGPSRNEELARFVEIDGADHIPVVLGSSVQSQMFVDTQEAVEPTRMTRVVELGYPSIRKHCIYPVPWMGFNGAVGLAQRLMDAVNIAH